MKIYSFKTINFKIMKTNVFITEDDDFLVKIKLTVSEMGNSFDIIHNRQMVFDLKTISEVYNWLLREEFDSECADILCDELANFLFHFNNF